MALATDCQPIADSVDHSADRDAPRRVRLRIEEQLDVADVVPRGSIKVGDGEVPEVLAVAQDFARRVVEIQKVLQIAEIVGSLDRR